MSRRVSFPAILNRTQLLVVSFFVLVWIGLVAILVLSPEVYGQTLRKVGGATLAIEASFLIALSGLIALLVTGVSRPWRWTFWLVLIAFSFGVFGIPPSFLHPALFFPSSSPACSEPILSLIGTSL